MNGINSLQVNNLRKIDGFDHQHIPTEAIVRDYIKDGDKIICDFDCNEVWVKGDVYFESSAKHIMSEINLKLHLDQPIVNFKKMMQKLVYCIWNKFCAEDEEPLRSTIYLLEEFSFKLSDKTID